MNFITFGSCWPMDSLSWRFFFNPEGMVDVSQIAAAVRLSTFRFSDDDSVISFARSLANSASASSVGPKPSCEARITRGSGVSERSSIYGLSRCSPPKIMGLTLEASSLPNSSSSSLRRLPFSLSSPLSSSSPKTGSNTFCGVSDRHTFVAILGPSV